MMMETVEVLNRYFNRNDYQLSKQKLLMKYGAKYSKESEQLFIKKMDLLQSIFTKVSRNIKIEGALGSFFFQNHYFQDMYANIASIIMMNFGDVTISCVSDYAKECKVRWQIILNSNVRIAGMSWSGLLFEKGGEGTLRERLSEEIDGLPCPLELKWGIQKLLTRFTYYVDILAEWAEGIEDELRQELTALDVLIEPMYAVWESVFEKSWMEDLERRIPFEQQHYKYRKVKLCLLRMPCDLVNVDERFDEDNALHVAVGITVEVDDNTDGSQVRVELISEVLKVLSEPNRFRILMLLSKDSLYGQEIADCINIDASTVSRHLNALLKYNLIYVEGQEGRNTYYRTNQSEMRNMILLLNKVFLNQ